MSILKLLSNQGFISYNKIIARRLGVNEAILIGELCSIQDYFRTEEFYIIQERISNDTALSLKQIRTTLSNLEEKGIITISKKGIPCKNFYRINTKLLEKIIEEGENIICEEKPENTEADAQSALQEVPKGNILELQKVTASDDKRECLLNNKNTDIRIHNKNTEIKSLPERNNGELQKILFKIINEHNAEAETKNKMAIPKDVFQFACKNVSQLLDTVGKEESIETIAKALENFLYVSNCDTWKNSFTWNDFVRHYNEYTPDFYSIEKYLNPEPDFSQDMTKRVDNAFFFSHKDNPEFKMELFRKHIPEWKAAGRPDGKAYYKLQKKWEEE